MKNTLTIFVLLLSISMSVWAQTCELYEYNLGKGFEMYKKGDIPEAMRYVDLHLKENPQSADALCLKGRLFIEEEKYANAIDVLGKAIKSWKRSSVVRKSSLYGWRASVYMALEKYDKSIDDLTSAYKLALKDDKGNICSILNERAEMYFALKDLGAADADYKLILKHNESSLIAMVGLARNMIQRKEYKEAVAMLDDCARYDKSYSEVYRFRMQAYDGLGEIDRAIDDVFSYLEYSDDVDSDLVNPILKKHLGYAFAKVNVKIVSDSRNYFWVWVRIGLHEANKDYVSAIADYNTVESETGAMEQIYYGRALCYQELGLYDEAISDINNCMLLTEDNYVLLQIRGEMYRKAARYKEAIVDFTKGIEMLPTNAFSYYARGWCYELMGNDELAMEDYCSGIDVDKRYPYIYLMRGEMHQKRGEDDKAKLDFEYILKIDSLAEKGSCRHYALHFLGKDDDAMEWMDRIIALDPEDAGTYYDKACLLGRMGRVDEAVATLAVALEKGYSSFGHIENDDDMDALRSHPDFPALIKNYKAKQQPMIEKVVKGMNDEVSTVSEVQMKKVYSGVYEIGCNVNALPLKFILDTGASIVSISSVEASFMLKNGYLSAADVKGKGFFSTATGEIREGTTIRLREIRIGDAVLHNVDASVSHSQHAPLLLGQSVLERFGSITIDNINSKLIIKQ